MTTHKNLKNQEANTFVLQIIGFIRLVHPRHFIEVPLPSQ